MNPVLGETICKILEKRSGLETLVKLDDGRKITVWNIAWGKDIGDEYDHITTNISPEPSCDHTVDFFYTSEVVGVIDPENNNIIIDEMKKT